MEHYFTNNENLKSELRVIKYSYLEYDFMFYSDNGVFSKDKVDFGSRSLLEIILKNYDKKNIRILDLGCGYGYMGIVLSKILDSYVDMCDVNKRAVHLTEKNIETNKVNAKAFVSDVYANVSDSYDLIVTNPPIRAGKETVYKILFEGLEHLNKDGELWFVIRKDQGAKSTMKAMSEVCNCELVEKNKGFYIIRAKRS